VQKHQIPRRAEDGNILPEKKIENENGKKWSTPLDFK